MELADRVAPLVHDHEAGGVFFLHSPGCHPSRAAGAALEHPRVTVGRVGRPVEVNEFGPFVGVFLGDQAQSRHICVVRVGHVGFPVDERQLFGFHHHMDALGRATAQRLEVKLLYQV